MELHAFDAGCVELVVAEEFGVVVTDGVEPGDLEFVGDGQEAVEFEERAGIDGIAGMEHKAQRFAAMKLVGGVDEGEVSGPVELLCDEMMGEGGQELAKDDGGDATVGDVALA